MQKFIIAMGYSTKELTTVVNAKIEEGYKPLSGQHQVCYIKEADVWEYTLAMVLQDGSS